MKLKLLATTSSVSLFRVCRLRRIGIAPFLQQTVVLLKQELFSAAQSVWHLTEAGSSIRGGCGQLERELCSSHGSAEGKQILNPTNVFEGFPNLDGT